MGKQPEKEKKRKRGKLNVNVISGVSDTKNVSWAEKM